MTIALRVRRPDYREPLISDSSTRLLFAVASSRRRLAVYMFVWLRRHSSPTWIHVGIPGHARVLVEPKISGNVSRPPTGRILNCLQHVKISRM